MDINRRIIIAFSLIVVIPALAARYLFVNNSVFTFSAKALVIFIVAAVSILGVVFLATFIGVLNRLYKSLNVIAKGNINHRTHVEISSGTEDLALSINQVSRKLRQSADHLQEKAILIERYDYEIRKMEKFKTTYLPDLVHELRTPLINIDKNSAMLLRHQAGMVGLQQETCLKSINDNAKRLTRLTNDLLDFAKMEYSQLAIKQEFFSMEDAANEAVLSVDNWRQSKQLELKTKIPKSFPKVYGDRDRIIQILVNLLSNAIKFTPPGGKIMVEARRLVLSIATKPSETNETFIEISVQDTGCGIDDSQKKAIFERFKTGQDNSSGVLPSTGLGLSIVKQIAQLHGGNIEVESEPGKGSKFTLIIPQGVSGRLEKSRVSSQKPVKRVLVIDDEDSIRELLTRELSRNGYFVRVAGDGLEGLKKVLTHSFDLVITDVRMPNIDGISCIEIFKKVNPNIFFIVMTGFAVEQELEEILAKNAYPCIRKPFDLPGLLKTVEESCFARGSN